MTPYIVLLIGLILTWLEFYLPGGIFAVAAALFVIAAQVSMWSITHSLPQTALFLLVSCVFVIAVVYFAIKRIRKSAKHNTFFLAADQEGFQAAAFSKMLIGKTGTTLTEFGPSGYVLIEGERYPATSRGPYLDKGQEVVVVAGESGHLIIKPIKVGSTQ